MKLYRLIFAAGLIAGCEHAAATSAPAATPPAATMDNAAPPPPAPAAAPAPAPAAAPMPMADAQPDAASDELRDHHRHHHHGGVTMFISMSIDTLGVPPEKQAQLEALQHKLHEQMKPGREAERKVIAAIADGVAAGQVRSEELHAAVEDVAASSGKVHAASADALNQLHALLTPPERMALANKVRAHWEVWRKVNGEENHETQLQKLTDSLKLTPDQVARIQASLSAHAMQKPDPAAAEAHVEAFANAFAADNFDAHTLNSGDAANTHVARTGAGRMIHFYAAVTPVLTPDQRNTLAGKLRERLNDTHAVSANN
jgi:Spy/CpxP family protein refolding chaperone